MRSLRRALPGTVAFFATGMFLPMGKNSEWKMNEIGVLGLSMIAASWREIQVEFSIRHGFGFVVLVGRIRFVQMGGHATTARVQCASSFLDAFSSRDEG